LDFNLLVGRDYVYSMKAIVSTIFHVISFLDNGRMVTIDQLSFIGPDCMTSLNVSYMETVLPLPQVNYVVLSLIPSTVDEYESLTISSVSYDLDTVVGMVISSIGFLELDLLTHVTTLNMVSFQSVSLSSSEDLVKAMTEFFPLTWCPPETLSFWKT